MLVNIPCMEHMGYVSVHIFRNKTLHEDGVGNIYMRYHKQGEVEACDYDFAFLQIVTSEAHIVHRPGKFISLYKWQHCKTNPLII